MADRRRTGLAGAVGHHLPGQPAPAVQPDGREVLARAGAPADAAANAVAQPARDERADLRAIYRYVKSLAPKGPMAPAYVPPGGKVATPYFDFTPKNLPAVAAGK